jgi:hypothetical protein
MRALTTTTRAVMGSQKILFAVESLIGDVAFEVKTIGNDNHHVRLVSDAEEQSPIKAQTTSPDR